MEKKIPILGLICLLLSSSGCQHSSIAQKPKNIVFVIVDGMGPEQVKAGRIFAGNKRLSFESFPHQSTVTTHNIDGEVTDSAAAATAMATGQKVKNRVVSPGKTLLEYFKEQGKSTGIVTNTLLTDATPAGFAAHAQFRSDTRDILKSYLDNSQPNLIAGADEPEYLEQVKASNAHYKIIQSSTELKQLQQDLRSGQKIDHVYAGFGMHALIPGEFDRKTAMPLAITSDAFFLSQDIPKISETATAALDILSQNNKGFFLMVESGLVDWIGHKNTEMSKPMEALSHEMSETNQVVQKISTWAKSHPDTLVIVTADHETGGLQIDESKTVCLGQEGCVANGKWTSGFYPIYTEKFSMHTGVKVGVYAMGPGSEAFSMPMDNTEFLRKILGQ
ncbi:MAG: alkaline phosphatase [Myxococcaceae bacterium]